MESPRTDDLFLNSADDISKLWWPERKRSTRLKDFAAVIARHNRALRNPEIPDYIKRNWARLPKRIRPEEQEDFQRLPKEGGRKYMVTLQEAKQFFDRHVREMPRDWYLHRDAKGRWATG